MVAPVSVAEPLTADPPPPKATPKDDVPVARIRPKLVSVPAPVSKTTPAETPNMVAAVSPAEPLVTRPPAMR